MFNCDYDGAVEFFDRLTTPQTSVYYTEGGSDEHYDRPRHPNIQPLTPMMATTRAISDQSHETCLPSVIPRLPPPAQMNQGRHIPQPFKYTRNIRVLSRRKRSRNQIRQRHAYISLRRRLHRHMLLARKDTYY